MSFQKLAAELETRHAQSLYRKRRILETAQGPEIKVNNKDYLAFCSNDYLGLANHPEVIAAAKQGLDQYGMGGGASHLVNGHSRIHHQLEEALAEFTQQPRALLFSTGYMANLGAINALLGNQDAVFQDKLNHASLLDAGLLSGARFQRYLHNDSNSLSKKLAATSARRKLIVTDGVFSMDGNLANIPELSRIAEAENAWLMVDDAHAFGVLGKTGAGCLEHFSLAPNAIQIQVGTLGKALGTAGAFVAGSEELIETLIQYARTYIYTTSMPPSVAAASLKSLELVQQQSWRREKLQALIQRFRTGARQLGLQLMDSDTAIQPILVGDAEKALLLSQKMEEQGIFISAIRPPTVSKGSARLRITFSANHTEQQVDKLLAVLEAVKV